MRSNVLAENISATDGIGSRVNPVIIGSARNCFVSGPAQICYSGSTRGKKQSDAVEARQPEGAFHGHCTVVSRADGVGVCSARSRTRTQGHQPLRKACWCLAQIVGEISRENCGFDTRGDRNRGSTQTRAGCPIGALPCMRALPNGRRIGHWNAPCMLGKKSPGSAMPFSLAIAMK